MNQKKYILLFSLLSLFINAIAAEGDKTLRYENYIYEDDIKTVLLYQTSTKDHIPVLGLNSNDTLSLVFDQLGTQNEYFQYTFIHCNSDWTPSDLQPLQYLDGNMYDNIDKYQYSNNTYIKYVNYRLDFPTEKVKPKLSGNYLLKVYRNFDENDLVITRRFYILDNKIGISGTAMPATRPDYRFNKQEVDFIANAKNYNIINPFQDAKVVMMQNYWQDNAIRGLKPLFVNGSELTYNYEEENVFGGINEFRFFDTRSLRLASPHVNKKYFFEGMYHAQLMTDEIRAFKRHLATIDYNGKRVIDNKDAGSNGNVDGDYVWVYFSLASEVPLPDSVYIMGELTDWRIQESFKMTYDLSKKMYETKVLLKQGFYDYMYVTVPQSGGLSETVFTEGNYFATENDYYIFFYVRNQFLDYNELLGFKRINTNAGK